MDEVAYVEGFYMLWQSLSPPWQACFEEAWTAYCADSFPIGAVVVDPAGQIVTRGRNRNHDHHADGQQLYGHPLAHAEMNALISVSYEQHDVRHGYAIYSSMEPCPLCFGAIYMSGVREVHYAARDAFAGSTNLFGTTPYLSRKPMRLVGPQDQLLEIVSVALLATLYLSEDDAPNVVIQALHAATPAGVVLGQRLAATNLLSRLRQEKATAAETLEQLAQEYDVLHTQTETS